MFNIGSARPFRKFAKRYLEQGWLPIPLPAGKKSPPPTGYTGGQPDVRLVDRKKVKEWLENADERSNVGFRAPSGVLGVDVDDYAAKEPGGKTKTGGDSLGALVEKLGALPDTWVSTARADGVSGIRWFRVPEDLVWPGKLGVDIESVWHRYRYAVAPPSVHPSLKEPYLWYAPGEPLDGNGSAQFDAVPNVDDLPELPGEWITELTTGATWSAKPYDESATRADLRAWIADRPDGEMCSSMRSATNAAVAEIDGAGSAHEAVNLKLHHVLRLASEGHCGVSNAISDIKDAFIVEVTDKARPGTARGAEEAKREFFRSRDGAVRLIMGQVAIEKQDAAESGFDFELPDECGCYTPEIGKDWGEAKDPNSYGYTELDNAYLIRDLHADNLRWLPKEGKSGEWVIWDYEAGAWYRSGSKLGPSVGRLAQVMAEERAKAAKHALSFAIKEAEKDAQQMGASDSATAKSVKADADVKKAMDAFNWAVKCKSQATKVASINQMKDLPGLTGDISDWDADPYLMQFPNGVLDLHDPQAIRAIAREDFVLRRMHFEYIDGALNSEWEDYLESSIPDAKVRDYLHRLAGYTLLGRNTEKKGVFLIGESNSGKSVMNDVLRKVFGTYGHTFDLTLLKSKREAGPRSDLLNAVPARFLAANESSEKGSIHADEFKRLTGGDEIAATAKYSNEEINATPSFTPWISTNEVPRIKIDKAIKNRIEPIIFPNEFKPKTYPEGSFSDHLLAVGGIAITAWLVDGLRKFNRRGLSGRPTSIDDASEAFALDAAGHLGEFVQECIELCDPSEFALTEDVSIAYETWCSSHDISKADGKMRPNELGRALNKLGVGQSGKKRIPERSTTCAVRFGVKVSMTAWVKM